MSVVLKVDRWQDVMNVLYQEENKSISDINRTIEMTYSHTSAIISELLRFKLINVKKVGRVKLVTLTEQGKKIGYCCAEINTYLFGSD